MADLAAHVNADAANYKRIQLDRGAGRSPRYIARYEKPIVGEPGSGGGLWVHEATSDVSQVDADTKALAALNGARKLRYGADATGSKGPRSGNSLTFDLH